MMERDSSDICFTMYVQKYIERYFEYMNFRDIFYREPYNETLSIIYSVYAVLALLFERQRYFNIISFY